MPDQPLVIAHRGFSARFPENTLAAIRGAIGVPADMVEIDVQQTADNQVVVFHDHLLRRLCRRKGRVSQVTLSELQHAKADVPTLSEVLTATRGRTRLLIEMKSVDPLRVARLIERAGSVDQVIVFAFELQLLKKLADASPAIPRYGLVAGDLRQSVRNLRAAGPIAGMGVDHRLIRSAADVRRLHRLVGPVFTWTVNRRSRMQQLVDWGVDGLITNHPDRGLRRG